MGFFSFFFSDPFDRIPDEDFEQADRECSCEAAGYDGADQSAAVYAQCMSEWMSDGDDDE